VPQRSIPNHVGAPPPLPSGRKLVQILKHCVSFILPFSKHWTTDQVQSLSASTCILRIRKSCQRGLRGASRGLTEVTRRSLAHATTKERHLAFNSTCSLTVLTSRKDFRWHLQTVHVPEARSQSYGTVVRTDFSRCTWTLPQRY
jgi:hypothetical protein